MLVIGPIRTFILCGLFLGGTASFALTAEEWIRMGDSLYSLRSHGSTTDRTDPFLIRMASDAYRHALSDTLFELEAGIRLLESLYFEGCFTEDLPDLRLKVFAEGKELGSRLLIRYPDDMRLSYWWVINLSLWAKESGPLSAIREGVAERIRMTSESMIGKGGPMVSKAYQILGRAHQLLPRIPFLLSWPDKKLAESYLKQAYLLDSSDLAGPLFLAELYRDLDRPLYALQILEPALQRKPRPEFLLEDRRNLWKISVLSEDLKMRTGMSARKE